VIDADRTAAEVAKPISLAMEEDVCSTRLCGRQKKFKEDLHDVGCTAWSARVGANKESDGNDGDTPVTTSAVIDADRTAAEVAAAFTEVLLMSQMVN
jgi:hypothetical protein